MKEIVRVAVDLPIEEPLDYRLDAETAARAQVGMRVAVSVQSRRLTGMITGFRESSSFPRIRPVEALLDTVPVFDADFLEALRVLAEECLCSWGAMIACALPPALRGRRKTDLAPVEGGRSRAGGERVLCHDPSGRGRWPFLASRIRGALDRDEGVILLVPEIGVVPFLFDRLTEHGLDVRRAVVLDRALGAVTELRRWTTLREGRSRWAVGTRSAVFAQVVRLGLVVILDEENRLYKEEQTPFHRTGRVAELRCDRTGADLVRVSAAPSLEAWLEGRERGCVSMPAELSAALQVVDLSQYKFIGPGRMSPPVQSAIARALEAGGRSVLLLNRRGFGLALRCSGCGAVVSCPRCNIAMTYLQSERRLDCRFCGRHAPAPEICPGCGAGYLRPRGGGIEKTESEAARLFPQARVARLDREGGEPSGDVIVATQAILRHLPALRPEMIALLDMDAESNRFDYRAGRELFTLLVHLRAAARRTVLVQTFQPDSDVLAAAVRMDFEGFYAREAALRRETGLPPFRKMATVVLRGRDHDLTAGRAEALHEVLTARAPDGVEIIPPHPDHPCKIRDRYRFRVVLKGSDAADLRALLRSSLADFRRRGVTITVDTAP